MEEEYAEQNLDKKTKAKLREEAENNNLREFLEKNNTLEILKKIDNKISDLMNQMFSSMSKK
jgi:hypothetical protein